MKDKRDKGVAMEDVPYARIAREGWVLIAILALAGTVAGWGITRALPPTYGATSTLMLQVDSSQSSLFERNQFSLARVKTYPALVDSPEVIDGVREDLGLDPDEYTDATLRQMLSAENTEDTVLLRVRADAPTPDLAKDLANSSARHLSDLLESTENSERDGQYVLELQQVLPASAPQSPDSPQVTAITGLGLIGGLALGAIIAVYRTTTRRRLLTISDVRKASGLPVFGQVARFHRAGGGEDRTAMTTLQDALENITALGGSPRSLHMVVPASEAALDDEVLTGLLEAHASLGNKACVIDLRARPSTGEGARPWTDVLDPVARSEVAGTHREPHLYVSGDSAGAARLASTVPPAIEILRKEHDVVIVVCDSGSSALQEKLVGMGAWAIISVRRYATRATELLTAVTRLRVMNIQPIGVLMTHVPRGALENVAESWRTSDGKKLDDPGRDAWTTAGLDLLDRGDDPDRTHRGARALLG